MRADGGDCEAVLREFAQAGVDVDALAATLQDEGAAAFVRSWNELMAVIASKSAALSRDGRNAAAPAANRSVLVIDVGGTHVKILASGQKARARIRVGAHDDRGADGRRREDARRRTGSYDAVAVGYPGPVLRNRPVAEPHNLGRGWVGFDFANAFGVPAKVDQRCRDAGARQLPGRQDAVPRPRHRSRHGDDRRRHRRADGARAPSLPQGDLRGLRRPARPRAPRQEEVAAARRTR